jgi:hypothetical protein
MHHRIDPPRPMLRPDATHPATPRTLLHSHRNTPHHMPTVHTDRHDLAAETPIDRAGMKYEMSHKSVLSSVENRASRIVWLSVTVKPSIEPSYVVDR